MKHNRAMLAAAVATSHPPGWVPLSEAIKTMPPGYKEAYLNALRSPLMAVGQATVGPFDTATLLEVLYAPAQAPALVGFWLGFFPRKINFDTQEIRFDAADLNEYRLAPFVSPNVQGRVMREKGYEVRAFRPAYVKPKHVVDPSRAIPRRAGEALLGSLSLQERFDLIVADNLRRERLVIENRWDWMACRAIVDGSVTVVGEDYPSVTVDFKRDPSLTVVLAGAAKWDQATATPMADIAAVRQNSFRLSGSAVSQLIFGLDAWNAFSLETHPDVQKLFDRMRKGNDAELMDRGLQAGLPYEYMGRIAGPGGAGRLEMYTYHYQYDELDPATDLYHRVDYLDSGSVVGTGPNIDGIRCFGAILDKRAGLQALDIFPKQWDEEDPSVSYTMSQSAPLMVPIRPNNTFRLKVV